MLIEAIEVVARRPQKAALHLEIAEKRQMPISLQANLRDTGRVVCQTYCTAVQIVILLQLIIQDTRQHLIG
ncbi:hypothetical protein Avbf_02697 [Armadillidium vulgare]|nr:hypothetical protein Avbf_02697 [Armadillidium vulgare]